MSVSFVAATAVEGDALARLRVEAMRPSLEAVGRFDPERAHSWFLDSFDPKATWKILRGDQLVGFFVIQSHDDHVYLNHLYVDASTQGSGIGGRVIDHVKALAFSRAVPIRLRALNGSASNAFYKRHGFEEVRRDDVDTYYELPCA